MARAIRIRVNDRGKEKERQRAREKIRPIAISRMLQAFSDGQTNRQINQPTNSAAYRVPCTGLQKVAARTNAREQTHIYTHV